MWLLVAVLSALGVAVVLVPARVRVFVWALVIVAGVLPWLSFQDHAHWARIGWIPFASPPVRVRDIVLNAVLYLPFGWWFGRRSGSTGGAHVTRAALWAFGLSIMTEATQIYSHGRFPSMTDVVMNTTGAALGAAARIGWRRGSGIR
jgi:glycopeptide antibiotics resistance protein